MDFNLIIRFDRFNSANLGTESIPVGNMVEKKENGGFGDSGLTSQDILDALRPNIEIPETAYSLNLTAENQVYDINNTLVVEGLPVNVPADIKVINTYLGGKIRLFKLTDSTENVNVTVYFDNTSTQSTAIELFDENNVFISSTSFAKNTVAALFYDKDTDIWTITPISQVALSEIYSYYPLSTVTSIKAPWMFQLLSNNVTLFSTTSSGNLRHLALTEFYRTRKLVSEETTTSLTYNLTNASKDYIEIINNYSASAPSQMVITLNDAELKGRQFLFHVKNNTTQQLTIDITSSIIENISKNVTLSITSGGATMFKITVFNNYIISTTV